MIISIHKNKKQDCVCIINYLNVHHSTYQFAPPHVQRRNTIKYTISTWKHYLYQVSALLLLLFICVCGIISFHSMTKYLICYVNLVSTQYFLYVITYMITLFMIPPIWYIQTLRYLYIPNLNDDNLRTFMGQKVGIQLLPSSPTGFIIAIVPTPIVQYIKILYNSYLLL